MSWFRTLNRKTWTVLSLTMISLSLLLTLARHMLLAMLCFVATAMVILTHTTTPGGVSPANVFATTVALLLMGLFSLSRCLVVLSRPVRAITSASITGTSALASSCLWNLKSQLSICLLLAKSYSTAHRPLCPKTLSVQFSDL